MNGGNLNSFLYAQPHITPINMHEFQGNPMETVGGVAFTRSFPYIFYRGKIIKGA